MLYVLCAHAFAFPALSASRAFALTDAFSFRNDYERPFCNSFHVQTVFLDIEVDATPIGRIVIELSSEYAPSSLRVFEHVMET